MPTQEDKLADFEAPPNKGKRFPEFRLVLKFLPKLSFGVKSNF